MNKITRTIVSRYLTTQEIESLKTARKILSKLFKIDQKLLVAQEKSESAAVIYEDFEEAMDEAFESQFSPSTADMLADYSL